MLQGNVAGSLERVGRAWRKSAVGRWWRYDSTLIVYRNDRPRDTAAPTCGVEIERNCRAHLERYVAERGRPHRDAFLRVCEARLATGEQVYTICPDGELLAYAWMVPNQETSWLSAVERELRYPPRSCVMYNAYTRPEARGRGYNTLLARVRVADAHRRFAADNVFTSIEVGNVYAARAKLASGFRPWLEVTLRMRFGQRVHSERSLWPDAETISVAAASPQGIVATAADRAPSPRET